MKKIISFFLLIVFILSSCKKVEKDVNDYYPVVKTVSATVLSDGTVEVKGEITSEGAAPINDAGFCTDTLNYPDMLDMQTIATNIQGESFSVVYSGLKPFTRYYFRSWATNAYGYSYGNIIFLDSIAATPLVAPCSPPMNTVDIGTGTGEETFYTVNATEHSYYWEIQAHSNSVLLNLDFKTKPVTGIYTTTTSTSPEDNTVNVNFWSGSIGPTLLAGSSVYVNQINSNKWEITICNAPWKYGSSIFYLTTKLICQQ